MKFVKLIYVILMLLTIHFFYCLAMEYNTLKKSYTKKVCLFFETREDKKIDKLKFSKSDKRTMNCNYINTFIFFVFSIY